DAVMSASPNIPPSIAGYELLGVLGTGGFGTVYRARQASTHQLVALKMQRMDQSLDESEQFRLAQRLSREAQLCGTLHHPHIVKLLDQGESDDNQLYVVYEYVPGDTLKALLSEGPLAASVAGELMGQMLDALVCAHEQGVVHRDLKPQNVMVTTAGARQYVKVLDFGIGAFLPEARKDDYRTLTLGGDAVGTPSYTAPEQLRGEPPTGKSDLYAWGLVFLECLTGEPAIQGATLAEIFHQQLSPTEVPLPPAIVGHPLANLLRRVLQKNQQDRAESAAQVYADFQRLNLSTIVGTLSRRDAGQETRIDPGSPSRAPAQERRQITVLCCNLSLVALGEVEPDFEALEALQRDQLSLCTDLGTQYGGYPAGGLGESVLLYFGYPNASDTDARRAARTALELSSQVARRSALLETQHGVQIELRIGMHTGMVLVTQGEVPEGLTPNGAVRLQRLADPGTILVSEPTKRLLQTQVEFETAETKSVGSTARAAPTFLMIGERRAEAFALLSGDAGAPPIVGRSAELEKLHALWTRTSRAQGATVLVNGEPGIGKSRLIYETRRLIDRDGFRVCDCRSLPERRNNALHPFLELLAQEWGLHDDINPNLAIARIQSALDDCQCSHEQALPLLCTWLALPVPEGFAELGQAPEQLKQIFLDVLEQLILDLGHGSPFLLAIEDLHWLDPTSLELLDRLVIKAQDRPILILMTTRPQFESRWDADSVNTLELQRLSAKDAEEMIRNALSNRNLDKNVLERLSARTDGVPLYVEELVRMLLERNALVERGGVFMLEGDEDEIPITLQGLLGARLDRLGPAKETAQVAAAIGRDFDYNLLVRAALRDEATVQADLARIVDAGLVIRRRRVQGEGFIFRHALIRDAAYDGMSSASRQQTHARLAASLERDFPERVEERPGVLARHHAGAGEYYRAVELATSAARRSLERSVNEEAIATGNQATGWLAELPESVEKNEVELALVNVMFPAVMAVKGLGASELVRLSERREALATDLETADEASQYLGNWVRFQDLHFQSRCAEAIALGEEVVAQARKAEHRQRELLVLPLLGQAYHWAGQLATGRERCERAIEIYRPDEDRLLWTEFGGEPKSQALFILSHILCCQGQPESAEQCTVQSLAWAQETGNVMKADGAVLFGALTAFLCGDADKVNELAMHHADLDQSAVATRWLVNHYRCVHDWANGSTGHSRNFIEGELRDGRTGAACWYETMLAATESNLGEYDIAIERMRASIARCRKAGEIDMLPVSLRVLATALFKRAGKLEAEAERLFLDAIEESRRQGAPWLQLDAVCAYAEVLNEIARPNEGRELLDPLIGLFSEGLDTPLYRRALALARE
nr:TOMM system kinase/cyclase fusion protein [Gammaproteobacteria bacterium]